MEFFEAKDNIMHDCSRNREDFAWETSVRLTLVGSEDIGMYLEEREGRKRKWQSEGKMMRREEDERELRKMPPKKIMATLGDMGGSGTSSSSSHMSPGWTTNDLDLDLPGELTMGDALGALSCALPGLPGFKQEALSPPGNVLANSRRAWPPRRAEDNRQITSMVVDNRDLDDGCQQLSPHNGVMMSTHSSPESMQCQPMPMAMPLNGYHSPNNQENKGLLIYSPNSLDSLLQSTTARSDDKDDNRFQYVLAAATSIATKHNEESLTYLNQGQPYEIKLKKLGDLAPYKQEKKIFKSVIKICFHERRLQYMEREQIGQWHAERPGERIIEVDVPLSYGVTRVEQPTCLNALHIYWDPTKDVGVYIKVNCISTEFTAKKHGGEKGVPFRIQVETYLANEDSRLHAAACQIKVFKLKGADRKHKQDREKVMRRPPNGSEKYQPGCEATVLSTLSNDALLPPPSVVTTSPPYSPEMCVTPKTIPSPTHKPAITQPAILASNNQMKPLYCSDGGDVKVNSPPCHSPGAILPDLPQPAEDPDRNCGLSKDATAQETQAWLTQNRFNQHVPTFTNFSGADLLRLSRDDIIQICGLADGIRLFNALHAKRIEPRLTVYVCPAGCNVYSALYLHACRACELVHKLRTLLPPTAKECETVLVSGPNGAPVRLTDELVRHLPDNSTYRLEKLEEDTLLLSPTGN